MSDELTVSGSVSFPIEKLDEIIEDYMPKLKGISFEDKKNLFAAVLSKIVISSEFQDRIAEELIAIYEMNEFTERSKQLRENLIIVDVD